MRRRSVVWAMIAVLALTGCAPAARAPSSDSAPASGAGARSVGTKHLSTALRGSPFTLSEAINAAGYGSVPGVEIMQEIIHAGLGVEDPQGFVVPRLVTELPTVENSLWVVNPDGTMQTTFKLRPNVFWHDGTPFSADDVAFTVRVAQDKRVAMYGSLTYQLIDRVETPDAQTVVLNWTQPYVGADKVLSRVGESRILPMPRHLLERQFNDDPTTFTDLPYWTSEFVGLGPFKVREIVEGSHMTLDAFEKYFLGRPRLDSMEVKFILDPNTVAANILAGAVELTVGGRYSIEWGIQIRDQWRSGRMEAPVATSWVALYPQLLNATPAVLENVQFRRALLHALHRQEMSDTIQAGLAPVAHAVIPPNTAEYREIEPNVVNYDFDPRRAAQLIENLGYTRGPDGIERDVTGQRLSMELRTRQGDDLQERRPSTPLLTTGRRSALGPSRLSSRRSGPTIASSARRALRSRSCGNPAERNPSPGMPARRRRRRRTPTVASTARGTGIPISMRSSIATSSRSRFRSGRRSWARSCGTWRSRLWRWVPIGPWIRPWCPIGS